jgi:hypothetical protein
MRSGSNLRMTVASLRTLLPGARLPTQQKIRGGSNKKQKSFCSAIQLASITWIILPIRSEVGGNHV